MKQRILAFLTAFCMVLALLPAQAFAQTAEPTSGYVSGCWQNPLYSHDGCSGVHGHLSAPQTYADGTLSPEDYLTDPQEVYGAIRTGLEQRQATISVPWRISAEGIPSEPEEEQQAALGAKLLEALAQAMIHTGVSTQGDYLQWVYGKAEYGASYSTDGTYYYLAASYEMTYYTTAEQEAELTAALEPVMASFGFTAETDDYTKVKTIYDYICANVTYDYTNLENEAYTLKFSAYAALINGTAVCQGYATLFYRMLLMAGVDTRVITGTSDGVNHAWNIVKLGDVYYNADSTWDAGKTEYSWLLKSPATFTDHTRSADYETAAFHADYPMATADYVPGEVHTHEYSTVVTPPTCTEEGFTTYTCTCGHSYTDNKVAATGHTEETIPAVAPTCTETGLTEGKKCSVCGEITVAQETVDATGHTWGDWAQTTPPTEDQKGEDTRECSVCHETETRDVDALGHLCKNHLTAKDAVAPTCTETGTKAHYLCSCGKLYSDADAANEVQAADLVVAATGHNKDTVIPAVAPTCTETGLTEGKKCSVCGEITVAQETVDATGHTEEVIPAKAPTCTETGLTEGKKCSVCGEILTAQETVDVLGHTWGDWVQTTAPTETEKGEDTRECSVCHETETREVPALGHLCKNHLTAKDAVAPTCTATGTKAHYQCSCGKLYSDANAANEVQAADLVVAATGHTEETIPAVAPTCTETGLTEGKKCSVCGEILTAQETVDVLGHTWGDWVQTTVPTEDQKGEDTRECSVCHETETREVPALGHLCKNHLTAKDAVAPTCTETGTKAHYLCSCGKLYSDADAANEVQAADLVVAATGHTEEVIPAKAPTCTETGLTEGKKCSVCGEILIAQETVDVLGHTWGDWVQTTAPTEDQKGEDTRECSVCHETETREVPALGHICANHLTAKDAVAPTCTEPGTKAHYLCSCGKLYSDADAANEVQAADLVVAATGHTEEVIPAKAPTCTETGLTEGKKCTVCGEILTAQETVDVLGHTWGDWVQTTAPTETEKGEDTRECSVCHDTETREVPALGHICANHLTAKDAVAPTCTEPGTKAHYLCSCGKLYSDADAANEVQAADLVVAATGHTEEAIPAVAPTCTKTGLTEGKKCSVCGEILTAQETVDVLGHTWGDWVQTTAPTETEKGEDTRECSVCHETETREVPALGHLCKNHLTAKDAVAPTCTETGTKAHYLCSCGKLYSDANAANEVQAADLVVAATGHTEETIPAKAPTCTETGLTEGKKCSVCGEILTAQETVPATGHTEETIPGKAPTCTKTGLTEGKKCSVCGEILTAQETVGALGHTYDHGFCSVCGAEKPGFIAGDFTGDDVLTDDDAIYLLWHTLFPELYPIENDGDLTGDGLITDDDAIYLLWHTLFPELYPLYVPATVSTTSDERGKKK